MAVLSGRLDEALLKEVPGGRLRADAADAWWRVLVAFKKRTRVSLLPTSPADTYRIYAIQERIFLDRYQRAWVQYAPGRVDQRFWNGVPYYRKPGRAAAAVPGTSNHGWGLAIDVAGLGGFDSDLYDALEEIGAEHGWDNINGRAVREPWHWEYKPANDRRPAAAQEEDEFDMRTDAEITQLAANGVAVALGGSQSQGLLRDVIVPAVWASTLGSGENRRTTLQALANAEAAARRAEAKCDVLTSALSQLGIDVAKLDEEIAKRVAAISADAVVDEIKARL